MARSAKHSPSHYTPAFKRAWKKCLSAGCENLGRAKSGKCKGCYNRDYHKLYDLTPQGVAARHKARRSYYQRNRVRLVKERCEWNKTLAGRYTKAKASANSQNREFGLTYEQYAELVSGTCHYCDGHLSSGGYSLDRKDNSIGYTPTNVVPCCGRCNRVKNSLVEYETMLKIGKILKEQDAQKIFKTAC